MSSALVVITAADLAVEAPRSPSAVICGAVQQLGSAEFTVRQAATDRLFHIGLMAIPALVAAAQSDDLEVSARALRLIVRIGKTGGAETGQFAAAALDSVADSMNPSAAVRATRMLELYRRYLNAALAGTAIELGGGVSVRPAYGSPFAVRRGSELPPGLFVVTSINLRGSRKATTEALRRFGSPASVNQCLLGNTPLDDKALEQLATWPGLQHLYLERTAVSDIGLRHLTAVHDLRTLSLTGTSITDDGLRHISEMGKLGSLDLESTRVTGTGLRHLTTLHELAALNLRNTLVTDAGLAHVAKLPRLKSLTLFGTPVTDAGLTHLASVKTLDFVDLRGTNVSEAGVKVLRSRVVDLVVRR